MATKLQFGIDNRGQNAFAPLPATIIFTANLTNGVPETITIPQEYLLWTVSFSYQPGTSNWVDFSGATAATPAGSSFAQSTSELNPGARLVSSTLKDHTTPATISIMTDSASALVSVAFYAS